MGTASIAAISAFVVLFALLMIGSACAIVYTLIILRREQSKLSTLITQSDLRFESHSISLRNTLESHRAQFDAQIIRINGAQLQEAVKVFHEDLTHYAKSATRIEKAAVALGDFATSMLGEREITDADLDKARRSGLNPTDYAPAPRGERYASFTRTADGDREDLAEEAEDNSSRYNNEG